MCQLRAADFLARKVPYAKMEPGGVGSFVLQPGERAVVPVRWKGRGEAHECSTHPGAPQGLKVLEGPCPVQEKMSIVVENESALPIGVTERDFLAIGEFEEEIPTVESVSAVLEAQEKIPIPWTGKGLERTSCGRSPQSRGIVACTS